MNLKAEAEVAVGGNREYRQKKKCHQGANIDKGTIW